MLLVSECLSFFYTSSCNLDIRGLSALVTKRLALNHHSIVWRLYKAVLQYSLNSTSATAAKSHQSCPTLCNHIDGSPPGSAIPGIFQAREPEWVAIAFSSEFNWILLKTSFWYWCICFFLNYAFFPLPLCFSPCITPNIIQSSYIWSQLY